uniref:CYP82BA1 n=1 Tax=Plumbago zeylanica TaxID=76149 RepID=A0A9E9M573_9CARY|nr:CYP82BA1 [Plumbago zeylanica]
METLLVAPTSSSIIPCLILLFLFLALRWSTRQNNRLQYPPEPSGSWPILGHLHLLWSFKEVPYKVIAKLADKYGPIFQLKLGSQRALVVSSWEMAKECLHKNDRAFVNRPRTLAFKHLTFDFTMVVVCPYGSYWREMRRISNQELLSNHRLEMLKHIRISEVRASVKEIYNKYYRRLSSTELDGVALMVDMKQWIEEVSLNSILRLVAGKSLRDYSVEEEKERLKKAIGAFTDLIGQFTLSDAVSYTRWLAGGRYEKILKTCAKELDFFAQGWLESHKRDRQLNIDMKKKKQQEVEFMDVMLDLFEARSSSNDQQYPDINLERDTDTSIKATCLALIIAGTDTSSVTLIWALSLLLKNPDALKKAQDELDTHCGKDRLVDFSDIKYLVYLQAVIKETMRLYPAGPLSAPRESVEDITLLNGRYYVRAGTRLLVNLHKIQRDPRVWGTDAEKFCPERFLSTHKGVDVRGQHFEMIPFGSGRRICPGISYALQFLPLTLANLIHGFEFVSLTEESVGMEEGPGLTSSKVSPLDVFIKPRLPCQLYENIN